MIPAILADNQHFHSTWQIDNAITAKSGGTLYGCYRQACRETHKRWRGLRDLYFQRQLEIIEIEELEGREPQKQHEKDRHRLEIGKKRLDLLEGEQVLRDSEREFLRFAGQALACRRALGLADSETMPNEMRERLDADFWEYQIRCLAAVDFITQGRLSKNVVELLVATSGETRKRLVSAILNANAHEQLVAWYLEHEPEMPEPVTLQISAQELVECGSRSLLSQLGGGLRAALTLNHAANSASD